MLLSRHKVIELFDNCLASPYDVNPDGRALIDFTAFSVAVSRVI